MSGFPNQSGSDSWQVGFRRIDHADMNDGGRLGKRTAGLYRLVLEARSIASENGTISSDPQHPFLFFPALSIPTVRMGCRSRGACGDIGNARALMAEARQVTVRSMPKLLR